MTKYDLKPIVKTFYDALEEGTILGRKCLRCGHIEFPPFLCCNACGGLDTEWVDLTNVRGVVKQALVERFQELLVSERPFIPLWFGTTLHVQSPTVEGIDYPSSSFCNENVWDWVKQPG